MAASLHIMSFGYLHGAPPSADVVIDLRPWLRDPSATEWCLPLTGRCERVRQHVLAMAGAVDLVDHLEGAACTLLRLGGGRPVVVAIGCAGGRHRSVALVEHLADRLRAGWSVEVKHRHVDRPVLTPLRGS